MTYAVFVLLFVVVVVVVVVVLVVVLGRGGVTCILVYVPGPDFKTAAERISMRRFRDRSTSLFLIWVTFVRRIFFPLP